MFVQEKPFSKGLLFFFINKMSTFGRDFKIPILLHFTIILKHNLMKWFSITLITITFTISLLSCGNDTAAGAEGKEPINNAQKTAPAIPPKPKDIVEKGNKINLDDYTPFKESDVIDFKERMKQSNAVLIDVRTPAEFEKNTLDGAININVLDGTFSKKVNQLDKTKTYLLFGATGMRSMRAARTMAEAGFKNIYSLTGGLGAWDRVNKELNKK